MPVERYLKKRIEIVIEIPLPDKVTGCLDRMQVSGSDVLVLRPERF